MGLITKAIKKVEEKESPLAPQKMPHQPKGKRRIAIALVALLFVGTSLGLGYFFLLRPSSEAPPNITRRSVSARKKPPKPAGAEQNKDAGEPEAKTEKKESASGKISEKSVAPENLTKKTGAVSKEAEKTSESEEEPPIITAQVKSPVAQEASETSEPEIEQPSEPSSSSTPIEEQEISTETIPPEEEKKIPSEEIAYKTPVPKQPKTDLEEAAPSFTEELRGWLRLKPLRVTERSDSKARRYYNKGVSYQQQGKFNRAIDSYRKALTFNPDHVQAHVNLAIACLQIGKFKEAERELIYAYALKPRDCQILFNFGLLLYQTGEYFSAETKLKRLLELDPFHLDANLLLASVYETTGEFSQAVEYCMKAYRIDSADPRVLYRLGRAWDMAGEPPKAIKYYRLFLNLGSEKGNELRLAVRDRLNYLVSRGEEK